MSETVSFLGGAAIAGLAALLFLRGGGIPGYSIPPIPQPSPVVSTPSPTPVVVVASPSPDPQNEAQKEAQKNELNNFRVQIEQQKLEIEKLRYYIQQQQGQIQTLALQAKPTPPAVQPVDAAGNPLGKPPQASAASQQDALSPVLTGLLWATGGAGLCLVGGTLLLGIFSNFSRQQSQGGRFRTVPYPMDDYERMYRRRYALPMSDEQPMRRVKQIDYED
jgi:hypothetical protein